MISKEIMEKAFLSYAKKYQISTVEASILFVNILQEIRDAQRTTCTDIHIGPFVKTSRLGETCLNCGEKL